MSRSRYFEVERADGKPANVIDYVCAAIMAVILSVFIIIPYTIMIFLGVAVAAVYVHIRYWITGQRPHR